MTAKKRTIRRTRITAADRARWLARKDTAVFPDEDCRRRWVCQSKQFGPLQVLGTGKAGTINNALKAEAEGAKAK